MTTDTIMVMLISLENSLPLYAERFTTDSDSSVMSNDSATQDEFIQLSSTLYTFYKFAEVARDVRNQDQNLPATYGSNNACLQWINKASARVEYVTA